MALDNTLVGEVCHIKGSRPGSARYDSAQSATERNHRDNLILMCPTHHTVIDDDEISYPVERLLLIKRDHEANATTVSEEEVARIAISLQQNVSTVGQAGGLSAHTVHANSITVQAAAEAGNGLLNNRQIQAVENLWQILRRLSAEFSSVVFVDTILLPKEMNAYFIGADDHPMMDTILEFRDMRSAVNKISASGGDNATAERPFVSQRLWSIYFVIQALYGRSALMLTNSFKQERYVDWRSDSGCDQLLRAVLPAHIVEHVKSLQVSGLRSAIDYLEDQFLTEAGTRKVQSA